jgi:hypothetical protein
MNAAPPPEQDTIPAPIAHADLTGCNSSPPKNSRQKDGFEHALRLDLANKDSVGASKYIFGFRSMSALEEWTVAIQHTTGATRVRRMSRAGAMLAKGRELSSAASSKVGLDMPLPVGVCMQRRACSHIRYFAIQLAECICTAGGEYVWNDTSLRQDCPPDGANSRYFCDDERRCWCRCSSWWRCCVK